MGAGTSISLGARGVLLRWFDRLQRRHFFSSAPDNVNHGENDDPHAIHKMPVHGKHSDASGLILAYAARQTEEQHDDEHDQTGREVKSVQADQRVIGRSKEVGGDGQPAFVDQPVPFLARAEKKDARPERMSETTSSGSPALAAFQELRREVDRDTARQQANGVEDRRFEHFARRRSGEALPHVEEIGHDENREDGRLGNDETGHGDLAAIREGSKAQVFQVSEW